MKYLGMPDAKDKAWILSHSSALYVQDGLVAMWDGIENAGRGVHDPDATTWRDLVGGVSLPISYMQGDVAVVANGASVYSRISVPGMAGFSFGDAMTMEMVWQTSGVRLSPDCITTSCNETYPYRQNNIYLIVPGVFALSQNVNKKWYAFPFSSAEQTGSPHNLSFVLPGVDDGQKFFVDGARREYVGVISQTKLSTVRTGVSLCASNSPPYDEYHRSLRIYNRALTADEIAANYALDKARFGL